MKWMTTVKEILKTWTLKGIVQPKIIFHPFPTQHVMVYRLSWHLCNRFGVLWMERIALSRRTHHMLQKKKNKGRKTQPILFIQLVWCHPSARKMRQFNLTRNSGGVLAPRLDPSSPVESLSVSECAGNISHRSFPVKICWEGQEKF